ncbi:hypothetical protein [Actinoplanes sp. NPDC051851]|uniref:hypothetical protein n=1 Tax=Actinoplanes sp. NPDC051851 TaxID=3154753 RepID=UPI00343E64A5
MNRRSLRLWVRVPLAVCTVLAGTWFVIEWMRGSVDWGENVALILAVVTLIYQVFADFGKPADNVLSSEQQMEELASAVGRQWYDEAAARRLRDPQVLALSWSETTRPVAAVARPPSTGTGGLVQRSSLRGRLEGDFDAVVGDLAARFRQLGDSSVVVLGQPGAGKSVLALLLTLAVIRIRSAGDPVPVLVPASSWDPISEEFTPWLTRTLAEAYYNGDESIPLLLMKRHDEHLKLGRPPVILPVIDGLDEIAESGRRQATAYLNRVVRDGCQIVVTCRAVEFEELIAGGAPRLVGVPVVEVHPVPPSDVRRYLTALPWPEGTSWERVLTAMDAQPEGPTSSALSTPLMVSLARLVYQRLGGDPGELLGTADSPLSRHEVEDRLVSRVVEAAYTPTPQVGEVPPVDAVAGPPSPGRSWQSADAQRWLTFLARYLHRTQQRDLVWWQLGQQLLSPWAGPALGIGAGALIMVLVSVTSSGFDSLVTGLSTGAVTGGIVALAVMVLWFISAGRPPGRLSFTRAGSLSRLRHGFLLGLRMAVVPIAAGLMVVALIIGLVDSWTLERTASFLEGTFGALACGVVLGLALAAHDWVNAPPTRAAQASPTESIAHDRRSAVVGSLLAGLTVAVCTVPAIVLGTAAGDVVLGVFTRWSGWPGGFALTDLLVSRAEFVEDWWGYGDVVTVLWVALLVGFSVGVLMLLSRAWFRYQIVRLVARVQGNLPWHLAEFLADARQREVLRQVSGGYQFRHIRLHDQLANPTASGATPQAGRSRVAGLLSGHPRASWVVGVLAVLAASALPLLALPSDGAVLVLRGAGSSRLSDIEVSPDERWIVGTGGSRVRVWDRGDGSVVLDEEVPGELDDITSYTSFLADGGDLTPGFDGNSRFYARAGIRRQADGLFQVMMWVWDLQSRERIVNGFPGGVEYLGEDRMLLVPVSYPDDRDTTISMELWDLGNHRLLRRFSDAAFLSAAGGAVLLVSERGGPVRAWDTRTGTAIPADTPVAAAISRISLSPDRTLAAVTEGNGLRLWNPATGRSVGRLAPVEGQNWTFDQDGTRVIASSGGANGISQDDVTIRIWDTASGRLLNTIDAPPNLLGGDSQATRGGYYGGSLEVFGDRLVAMSLTGADGTGRRVHVWDVATAEKLVDMPIGSAQVSSNGRWLLTTPDPPSDGSSPLTTVWNLSAGGPVRASPTPIDIASDPTFSPDENHLIGSGEDGLQHLWDPATGRDLGSLGDSWSSNYQSWVAGDRVMVMDNGRFQYYDVRSSHLLFQISPNLGYGGPWASSADGRSLAIAVNPEGIGIRDGQTGIYRKLLTGHVGPVAELTFVDEGRYLVSLGYDGTARVWEVPR